MVKRRESNRRPLECHSKNEPECALTEPKRQQRQAPGLACMAVLGLVVSSTRTKGGHCLRRFLPLSNPEISVDTDCSKKMVTWRKNVIAVPPLVLQLPLATDGMVLYLV
jgi:hypothetical protein